MRLDHLLSKEEVRVGLLSICQGIRAQENAGIPKERQIKTSGGDALRGNTRSHPEHEG